MTHPRRSSSSGTAPLLAFATELPPGSRRAAVGEAYRGNESVKQAQVVAAAVKGAQSLEQLVGIAAPQLVRTRDAKTLKLARHRWSDVRDRSQLGVHSCG